MRRQTIALTAFAAMAFAGGASAQTSVPGSPGGNAGSPGGQILGEGFFGPTSAGGGVGSGAVGSPVNTNPNPSLGLFGPGGFFANAKPVDFGGGNGGAYPVDFGGGNGSANGAGSGGAPPTTTHRPSLAGVGPHRFF